MINLFAKILFVGLCFVNSGHSQGLLGTGLINNPATALLEGQIQLAIREQQTLANQLINNGNRQISLTGNQIQIAKNIQNANIQRIASQGLLQLNNLGNLIFAQDIRQCYQRNSFSFSNAINTAKSTASQCISDKIDQANSIIQQARSDIQTAFQNIVNGYQLISQCSQITSTYPSIAGILARTACLQEANVNIRTNIILLPINMGRRILDATESVATVQSDIVKCSLTITQAVGAQATNAAKVIAQCIANRYGTTESSGTTQALSGTTN